MGTLMYTRSFLFVFLWLSTLLSIMFSWYIHVDTNNANSFFEKYEWYSIECKYHIFICLSISIHLGGFNVYIMLQWTLRVQISFWDTDFNSSVKYPEVRLLESYGSSTFNLWREIPNSFLCWQHQFTVPPTNNVWVLFSSHLC